MTKSWKQIFSGRITLVLFCAGLLAFAFVGFATDISNKDNLPNSEVPMTIAAAPVMPVIDKTIVKKTEFALFALG